MNDLVRLTQPRVPPLPESEWTEDQRAMLLSARNPMGPLNIFRTLVRHPEFYRRFMKFSHQVLHRSSLTPPERELAVLRVAWLCRSKYEFHQHTSIGIAAGLNAGEIERVRIGPDAPGWSPAQALLLRAVDELHDDSFISDATWTALSRHYDIQQLIDFVFLVGHYSTIAMALNTLGVQVEEEPVAGAGA